MEAGRELDKRVYVDFLGGAFDPSSSYPWDAIKPYSTQIAAAWEVWMEVLRLKPSWALGNEGPFTPAVLDTSDFCCLTVVTGKTHMEAICLAALEAKHLPNL